LHKHHGSGTTSSSTTVAVARAEGRSSGENVGSTRLNLALNLGRILAGLGDRFLHIQAVAALLTLVLLTNDTMILVVSEFDGDGRTRGNEINSESGIVVLAMVNLSIILPLSVKFDAEREEEGTGLTGIAFLGPVGANEVIA